MIEAAWPVTVTLTSLTPTGAATAVTVPPSTLVPSPA